MLNTHQQVEFLIAGLHANGAALPALVNDPAETIAHQAYHSGSPVEFADLSGHDRIDALVGRWAKTGNLKFIGELVRVAKHRDGSTTSLVDSLYAMDLLNSATVADPSFKAILRNFGYDSAKPTHGDFANGLTADDFSAPEFVDHPINSEAEGQQFAADLRTERALYPGAGVQRVPFISDLMASMANIRGESDGTVFLDFGAIDGAQGTVKLPIGVAAELQKDLGHLIEELTLPALEGYSWNDAEDGLAAILVAEGRKTTALFADKTKFPGTRNIREIGTIQHDPSEMSQSPFAITFGDQDLGRSNDLTDAKFTLAQHVREYVAAQTAA